MNLKDNKRIKKEWEQTHEPCPIEAPILAEKSFKKIVKYNMVTITIDFETNKQTNKPPITQYLS